MQRIALFGNAHLDSLLCGGAGDSTVRSGPFTAACPPLISLVRWAGRIKVTLQRIGECMQRRLIRGLS
ncbi:hypothetical protein Xcaj_02015 [Xanthomonas axonopodis pv. cajani]|uniref:Uncharacterized protein n=1 Tax=Xanthomonas axonopodis pv. cajani TaxID=487827 RepID=A0ABX3M9I3_9XANT|nr:hypothetical protein Xcaj_02015 [Xanthomonas axonopodis pv. cajani]